jgi:hypothetical protein
MIQLARQVPGLPAPERQWRVCNGCGEVFAKLDLAWPGTGLFIELDGQQHKGQAVYDARRETAVVAATGWFCGRFTWREVVYLPVSTFAEAGGPRPTGPPAPGGLRFRAPVGL